MEGVRVEQYICKRKMILIQYSRHFTKKRRERIEMIFYTIIIICHNVGRIGRERDNRVRREVVAKRERWREVGRRGRGRVKMEVWWSEGGTQAW